MLIRDEVRIERDIKGQAQESYADSVNRWTKEQLGSARVIADLDMSSSNPQRQLGHMLEGPQRLELGLRAACPNLVFQHGVPGKKLLSYQMPDGTLNRICVYEAGPTPEYSIMNAKWVWEADPDFALGQRKVERDETRGQPVTLQEAYDLIRELGPQEAKRELLARRSDQGLDDRNYRPGFRKVLQTWSEAIRGWRAVIVRPLQLGYISLEQAKNLVKVLGGTEDRPTWAVKTGQRSDLRLS